MNGPEQTGAPSVCGRRHMVHRKLIAKVSRPGHDLLPNHTHTSYWDFFKSLESIYYINKGVLEEAKRSHHVRREGQEIPTLILKRKEFGPLDFIKI